MFSTPCPEYITQYPQPSVLTRLLDEPNREVMAAIKAEMSASLSPLNEPTGKAIGFFEQGLLTGLGVAVVAAVVGSGYLIGYVSPVIIRRFR
jgi:ABC-type branched-subunit amino acid transport system ATPase component